MLKLKRTFLCQMMFLCSLVLLPISAYAGTISLAPAGGASFNVLANGFTAPSGFHLVVNYDSARLANPRVVQGSLTTGAMFIANPNVAGSVQFAVVSPRPMQGSGTVATITFDQTGDSAGTLSVSGTVINVSGKNLPVSFSGWSASPGTDSTPTGVAGTETNPSTNPTTNPTTNPSTSPTTNPTTSPSTNPTVTTGGTSTGFPVTGGSLTMPSDDAAVRDRREAPAQPQPTQPAGGENAAPPAAGSDAALAPDATVAKKKVQADLPRPVQSVLEKFRLFAGEKTPQNLMALFDPEQGSPFSQSPAICITDGKTSVQVLVTKVSGDKAPNFAFNHAHYQSIKQVGDGEWQIGVLPDKGALNASISMLTDGVQQEIPLTVAPRVNIDLDKSGTVTEADFRLFLKTRGTDAAPKYDLNGDGKRDYQDDYIFTANYLAMKGKAKK